MEYATLKGILSTPFLNYIYLAIEAFCITFKISLFFRVFKAKTSLSRSRGYYYLLAILLASSFIDVSRIIYYLRCKPFSYIPLLFNRSFSRLEAVAWLVQFSALTPFFIEISSKKVSKKMLLPFFIFTIPFSISYFLRAFHMYFSGSPKYLPLDFFMDRYLGYYVLLCCISSLLTVIHNYKNESVSIVKHQNYILGKYFILPNIIVRMFELSSPYTNPILYSLTTLFLTSMLGYSFYKLFGMRFLNITNHVTAPFSKRFKFMDDFQYILGQFPKAQDGKELDAITKEFFELAFKVPRDKVHLLLKGKLYNRDENEDDINAMRRVHLDELLKPENDSPGTSRLIKKKKILITDEVEFTNFYEPVLASSQSFKNILSFLKRANVDLVLPLFCGGKFSGAIVVERNCREEKFFTDVERDQMLLFINYLSSMIYMLLYNDVDSIVDENQQTKKEIYKHKKLFKILRGSIGSFMDNGKTEKMGVLVYKNKKFLYCNKDAHDLIKANLNKDKGLEITKTITEIALESAKFFTEQRAIVEDLQGQKLVIKAMPNVEKNNTVLTVAKPNVADIIGEDSTLLIRPSQWNTLLALRTTEEGDYVNQLIPADTRMLLNLKVDFLEKATTRKALAFELTMEDSKTFAHVAHKINSRGIIEEVDVANNEDLANKLFGANKEDEGLLKKLDKRGTLLLQNVHMLDRELQKKLYEFVTSGTYNPMQGDDKLESDVLIIFSSNQNLRKLVEKGLFLRELYHALALGEVVLPPFSKMDKQEVLALSEGLRQRLVANKLYSNILVLNDADKKKIVESNCVSLHELAKKVKHLVLLKTKKQSVEATRAMDPAYGIADFELMSVARLGKDALKDPRAMELLMDKFNGNRNKISEFLGVNRSSVCRRVEQYNLDKSAKGKHKSI